ncbi:MAG: DUF354 domain-containing protein [Actinomycetota bacterium]|nr:DUF354 domain-containing protein [Actinomycetota bacterium]
MRVWIDMNNSPHPLLFAPVARRLQADGHEVLVTARDNAQTVSLTLERWPDAEIFGTESPPHRAAKVASLGRRFSELRRWAAAARPDVALSHNSYAQIVTAKSLRVRVVTAMDFEHQPANHLAFRLAHTVLLPEALPARLVRRQGARARKVRHYPGLKEELYLADFEPDPTVEERIGVRRNGDTALVVVRTPPSRATYHQFDNLVFEAALRRVCSQSDVVCVVLPRHAEQREEIELLGLSNCVVCDQAVDSRSLMSGADLVLGAGGTMTREAALLGVPVYSLFAGRAATVDDWLIQRGLLRRLERAEDLPVVTRRLDRSSTLEELARRAQPILQTFVDVTLARGAGARQAGVAE